MQNKFNKVSVIIPTFNYAHYLGATIDSVLAQKLDNLEVLVVDDGSTDDTASLIEQYGSTVTYIFQENRGLSAARNTGLQHASGDYIQFLDSDDVLGQDAIAARIGYLERDPNCSIAVCRNQLFSDCGPAGRPVPEGAWELYRSDLATHLCRFNIAPPHAFLLRRSVVEAVGEFDTTLRACEDYDYWLRAIRKGFTPKFCPDGMVFYRTHATSMSANRPNQVRHDAKLHLRLFDWLFKDADYKMNSETAACAAFMSGSGTTIVRLRRLENSADLLRDLESAFGRASKVFVSSYSDVAKNNFVVNFYVQWLTALLKIYPDLINLLPEGEWFRQLVARRGNIRWVVGQYHSTSARKLPDRVVANRYKKLLLASGIPWFASRVGVV